MRTIIWDFDYTLFDAARFKEDLKEAVVRQGVPAEKFYDSYQAVVEREGHAYDYDPYVHLALMAEHFPGTGDQEQAKREMEEVLADAGGYLYAGAGQLLAKAKENGDRNVLVTLGNQEWQRAKVNNSGIDHLFDEIVSVDSDKVEAAVRLAESGPIAVVNDNGWEVMAMRQALPEAEFVLVAGPKGQPETLGLKPTVGISGIEAALRL